jgi:Mn2+/Fe2+ NRAMP family transporter
MPDSVPVRTAAASRPLRWTTLFGPGLLVMLADCDAGNVVTAAQSGAQWGYRLALVILGLIPLLYMVQELTARLAVTTGRGFGELVRETFGPAWAWLSAVGLVIAVLGSLVTEFTGVAGIGEMAGISRSFTLPLAVVVLIAVVMTGSNKRVHRAAMIIGAFELIFLVVAWRSHPDWREIMRQSIDLPCRNPEFSWLVAALIGATFNPWMVFYQQAAVAARKLSPDELPTAKVETAVGAVLTQVLTAAVLVAAAAAVASHGGPRSFATIGEIGTLLSNAAASGTAEVLFGAAVLGASIVAAIVCSLALAGGLGEITGYSRSLDERPASAPWFYGTYIVAVGASAFVVWLAPNLVSLTIDAQVVNALMLPVVIGLLIRLAATSLPEEHRIKGVYLWVVSGLSILVCTACILGAVHG